MRLGPGLSRAPRLLDAARPRVHDAPYVRPQGARSPTRAAPFRRHTARPGTAAAHHDAHAPHAPPPTPLSVLHRGIFLLDKWAETRDPRFLGRVVRYSGHLRKHLPLAQLRPIVDTYVLDVGRRAALQELLTVVAAGRKEPPVSVCCVRAVDGTVGPGGGRTSSS